MLESSPPSRSLEEGLDDFSAISRVVVVIAVVLVLLIAFNASAINAEERSREHATMFAYGLPVRTVLRLAVSESLIIGILATGLGIAAGSAILFWVVNVNLEEVLTDLGAVVSLSGSSILLAALAGAGADGRGTAADRPPPAPHGHPLGAAGHRVRLAGGGSRSSGVRALFRSCGIRMSAGAPAGFIRVAIGPGLHVRGSQR